MVIQSTTANMCQNLLNAYLEVVLCNATGQHAPQWLMITNDRMELNDCIPIPVVAIEVLLMEYDVNVNPRIRNVFPEDCGCHIEHLSNYSGTEGCCNPHTHKEDLPINE